MIDATENQRRMEFLNIAREQLTNEYSTIKSPFPSMAVTPTEPEVVKRALDLYNQASAVPPVVAPSYTDKIKEIYAAPSLLTQPEDTFNQPIDITAQLKAAYQGGFDVPAMAEVAIAEKETVTDMSIPTVATIADTVLETKEIIFEQIILDTTQPISKLLKIDQRGVINVQ
jgi:hypothetical protein